MLLTLIRAAILYVFVILMVKFMGKRQVGQLQPAEFVITILISDIVTMPVQDSSISLLSSMFAVILLVSLEVLLSGLNLKSFKLRTAVQGNSLIVIRNGVIDQPQLKRLRIGMDDLLEALRLKDVFDINEVQYAIIETNGELSVMLKPEKRNITAEMMKLKCEDEGIPCSVVIDGFIVESAFKDCGMTREKLEKIIKRNKIPLEKIMLMTVDKGGNTTVIKRDEKI